jgi:hypothetical protein
VRRLVAASAVLSALALTVGVASAQVIAPVPPGATLRIPSEQPQELPLRAPFTITPSIAIAEEYNDNVRLNNRNKQWDFITAFVPGISVTAETTRYRLLGAYNFRADIYARDSSLNEAFDRHNLLVDGLYRVSPALTLTLLEGYFLSTDTNLINSQGVATGRGTSWSNSFTPGASYQLDRQNTLRGLLNYTVLRYSDPQSFDSDAYRVEPSFDHIFSPRLTGTIGYKFGYFDIHNLGTAIVNTPLVGVAYRVTETLTLNVNGGPSITDDRRLDETHVTPAITASATQRLFFGTISFLYDRAIGTAGGLGGVTDNQSVGGAIRVTTLVKNLSIELIPRYNTSKSFDNSIDVRGWTVPLRLSYQFNRYVAAIAGYQFFHQRANGTLVDVAGFANDVDQNRVTFGLQFGYPIDIQ